MGQKLKKNIHAEKGESVEVASMVQLPDTKCFKKDILGFMDGTVALWPANPYFL